MDKVDKVDKIDKVDTKTLDKFLHFCAALENMLMIEASRGSLEALRGYLDSRDL